MTVTFVLFVPLTTVTFPTVLFVAFSFVELLTTVTFVALELFVPLLMTVTFVRFVPLSGMTVALTGTELLVELFIIVTFVTLPDVLFAWLLFSPWLLLVSLLWLFVTGPTITVVEVLPLVSVIVVVVILVVTFVPLIFIVVTLLVVVFVTVNGFGTPTARGCRYKFLNAKTFTMWEFKNVWLRIVKYRGFRRKPIENTTSFENCEEAFEGMRQLGV